VADVDAALKNSRSSTFRSDSGYLTYIITTSRITSGEESNQRKGSGGSGELAISPPYLPPVSLS
jgi:hypothetical protein